MLQIERNFFFADIKYHRRDIDKYRDHMSKVTDVEVSAFSECFLFSLSFVFEFVVVL